MTFLQIIRQFGISLIGLGNWFFGSCILVYIIWTLNTVDNFQLIISGKSLITISQLIFGLLVSIKGLLGLFGACRKQQFLLKLFLFLAVMTISIELGTFISLKVANVQVANLVDQSWAEANINTRNYIQRELKCCGLTGLSEFASKLDPIDDSCYNGHLESNHSTRQPFRVGCKSKLIEWANKRKANFIIITSVILIIQILSIILVLIHLRYLKPKTNSPDLYNEEIQLTRRQID